MQRTLQVFKSRSSFLWSVQRFGSTENLRGVSVSSDGAVRAPPCGVGIPLFAVVSLIRDGAAEAAHGS